MDIVGELMNQVGSGSNLSMISTSVGGDEKGVQSALAMGLPMIMGSMASTASKPGGADMISGLVQQMGGSNPADNLGSYLSSPGAAGGAGMANTLLGSQMAPVQNAIAQKTGLPPAIIGKVLAIAVPLVLGAIGKKAGSKIDTGSLTGLLGEESKSALASSPEAAALAGQLLGGQKDAGQATGLFKKFLGK